MYLDIKTLRRFTCEHAFMFKAFSGCLITPRKRMDWDTDRNENFKLSSLLGNRVNRKFRFFEKRPNTRDFNKLGTEPETSDDENCENHLTNII